MAERADFTPLRRIVARFRTEADLNVWLRRQSAVDLRRLAAGDDVVFQVLMSAREDARKAVQH